MPNPSGTFADGGLMFGAQASSLGGVSYIFEKIDIKQGARKILQTNQYGVPANKIHVRTLIEGTATLQFPTQTTRSPAQFTVFTLLPAGSSTPFNFILEEVGEAFEHEGETKAQVTFSEQLSPPQTYT